MREEKVEIDRHPFEATPHRTLLLLSLPVLFSLTAEPLTALVDTAFVARLGSISLAALGVGATLLSSVFWLFNFLGIGSQTAVAQASGRGDRREIASISTVAFLVASVAGIVLIVLGFGLTAPAVALMGASDELARQAISYMQIRLLGAPAVLVALAAFGVLRGRMDMRSPLRIAVGINALNIALDPLLIFGLGPVPALGIRGAAVASTLSQWAGAVWAFQIVLSQTGFTTELNLKQARQLLRVGGDLFIRTGLLNLFLVLATRTATMAGAEAGAAHQAIRQCWIFTALLLDAFAITCQSLVGYFVGKGGLEQARHAAKVTIGWSLGTGVVLGLMMLAGQEMVSVLLVPAGAAAVFSPAWRISALTQPLNAVSFATDGVHWGTGDFRFLRNVVILVTLIGVSGLSIIKPTQSGALSEVWIVTTIWIGGRALLGFLRVWPGIGKAPLGTR